VDTPHHNVGLVGEFGAAKRETMKRAWILLVGLAILTATPASARSLADRMWFGGGVGLAFGGNSDYVEVAPVLGFSATEKVSVGIALLYRYRNDKRYAEDISTNDYGGSVFARYRITRPVFLHAEYEYLSYEFPTFGGSSERDNFDSWLAGVGFSQPIGGRASFFLLGLYNFSYDEDDLRSPYAEPWVLRAGVVWRF